MMSDYVVVAAVGDIPPGSGKTVDVNGVRIALFNIDGTFYAVDNTCPHAGGPLGEGLLTHDTIECPWHGWEFNLKTGERKGNPDITVACCHVKVEGDQVLVALPDGFT